MRDIVEGNMPTSFCFDIFTVPKKRKVDRASQACACHIDETWKNPSFELIPIHPGVSDGKPFASCNQGNMSTRKLPP